MEKGLSTKLLQLNKYVKEEDMYRSFSDFLRRGSLTYQERLVLSSVISRSCLEKIQNNFRFSSLEIKEPFPIINLLESLVGSQEKSFWEAETLQEDLKSKKFCDEVGEILEVLEIIFLRVVIIPPMIKKKEIIITPELLEDPNEVLKLISRKRIDLVLYDDIFLSTQERFGGAKRKNRKTYNLLSTQPILSYLLKNPSKMPEAWKEKGDILFGIPRYVRGVYGFFFEIQSGYYHDNLLFNKRTGKLRCEMLSTGFDLFGYVPVINEGH